MKMNKLTLGLLVTLSILVIASTALNVYLFRYSKQYYLQLNGTRLDPLGLSHFPRSAEKQTDKPDSSTGLVIFYGDSRAAQWPSPTVEGVDFINRGIGAQTSTQVLYRYEQHVQVLQPDILIVQVCINDLKTIPLFPHRKQSIVAACQENVQEIVQKARADGTTVILTTIFPVGSVPLERRPFWSDEIALAVKEVNDFIRSLAGEKVLVFDSFALLADEQGKLRKDYSRDELHLNAAGYEALNRSLVEVIETHP